jgi:hypothetical protein
LSDDDIGRDRACAAPKVTCGNSQAKGPISDETLESHGFCGAEEAIREAENLSGKRTETRLHMNASLFFCQEAKDKGESAWEVMTAS